MAAVSTIVFSFTGTPYFFPIVNEMKDPKEYFRSMYTCQTVVFTVYFIIGVTVYYFCGSHVTSPALGSAGDAIKSVAYGIALPGLLVTSAIVCHVRLCLEQCELTRLTLSIQVPAKNCFVRLLKNNLKHLQGNTGTHWAVWLGCTSSVVLCAYIIASAIPVFSELVSLVGALLGT